MLKIALLKAARGEEVLSKGDSRSVQDTSSGGGSSSSSSGGGSRDATVPAPPAAGAATTLKGLGPSPATASLAPRTWKDQATTITSTLLADVGQYKSLAVYCQVKLAQALEAASAACPDTLDEEGRPLPNKLRIAVACQLLGEFAALCGPFAETLTALRDELVSAIYSGWAEARTAAPLGFDQLPWSAVAARLAADNAALKEEQAALRQGLEEHQLQMLDVEDQMTLLKAALTSGEHNALQLKEANASLAAATEAAKAEADKANEEVSRLTKQLGRVKEELLETREMYSALKDSQAAEAEAWNLQLDSYRKQLHIAQEEKDVACQLAATRVPQEELEELQSQLDEASEQLAEAGCKVAELQPLAEQGRLLGEHGAEALTPRPDWGGTLGDAWCEGAGASSAERLQQLVAEQAAAAAALQAILDQAAALAAPDCPPAEWHLNLMVDSSSYFITEQQGSAFGLGLPPPTPSTPSAATGGPGTPKPAGATGSSAASAAAEGGPDRPATPKGRRSRATSSKASPGARPVTPSSAKGGRDSTLQQPSVPALQLRGQQNTLAIPQQREQQEWAWATGAGQQRAMAAGQGLSVPRLLRWGGAPVPLVALGMEHLVTLVGHLWKAKAASDAAVGPQPFHTFVANFLAAGAPYPAADVSSRQATNSQPNRQQQQQQQGEQPAGTGTGSSSNRSNKGSSRSASAGPAATAASTTVAAAATAAAAAGAAAGTDLSRQGWVKDWGILYPGSTAAAAAAAAAGGAGNSPPSAAAVAAACYSFYHALRSNAGAGNLLVNLTYQVLTGQLPEAVLHEQQYMVSSVLAALQHLQQYPQQAAKAMRPSSTDGSSTAVQSGTASGSTALPMHTWEAIMKVLLPGRSQEQLKELVATCKGCAAADATAATAAAAAAAAAAPPVEGSSSGAVEASTGVDLVNLKGALQQHLLRPLQVFFGDTAGHTPVPPAGSCGSSSGTGSNWAPFVQCLLQQHMGAAGEQAAAAGTEAATATAAAAAGAGAQPGAGAQEGSSGVASSNLAWQVVCTALAKLHQAAPSSSRVASASAAGAASASAGDQSLLSAAAASRSSLPGGTSLTAAARARHSRGSSSGGGLTSSFEAVQSRQQLGQPSQQVLLLQYCTPSMLWQLAGWVVLAEGGLNVNDSSDSSGGTVSASSGSASGTAVPSSAPDGAGQSAVAQTLARLLQDSSTWQQQQQRPTAGPAAGSAAAGPSWQHCSSSCGLVDVGGVVGWWQATRAASACKRRVSSAGHS